MAAGGGVMMRKIAIVLAPAVLAACNTGGGAVATSPQAAYDQALKCEGTFMEYVVLASAVAVPGQVPGGSTEEHEQLLQEVREFGQNWPEDSDMLIQRGKAIGMTQSAILAQRREATNTAEARVRTKRQTLGTWDAAKSELAALRSEVENCPQMSERN